jgi:hypothetical protein
MPRLGISIGTVVLALFIAAGAHGETIGPVCGSCYGATYTLNYLGLVSSTATTETYRIEYIIETLGYSRDGLTPGPTTDYLRSVAIKVSDSVYSAALFNAPSGGAWTVFSNTGLSNNNCSGGGGGWVCAQDGTSAVADGSTYTWVFDVTMAAGSLFTGSQQASIKANWDPANGIITSERISVPESAGVELLLGVAGLCLVFRRKLVGVFAA